MGTSVQPSMQPWQVTPGLDPTKPRPDAIAQLLRELTGAPMPGPQLTPSGPQPGMQGIPGPTAAPLPAPMAATTAQSLLAALPNESPSEGQKPRLVSRIAHSLLSLPHTIAENTRPQLPAEYQAAISAGLLSPDEAKAARPGFLSSIAGDAAQNPNGLQGEYSERLGRILQMKQVAGAMQEQQRLKAVRATMEQMFQAKADETLEQERERIEKMYSYAVQHGDLATAKSLEGAATESLRRPTASSMAKVIGPGATLVDAEGRVLYQSPTKDPSKNKQLVISQEGIFELRDDGIYNVATGQRFSGKGVHPVSMLPNYAPIQDYSAGEGAPPQTLPFNTKTGTVGDPIATGKPAATRIESALNTAAKARLEAAVSEMNNAHENMSEYEHKLATGKANISGLAQFLSSTANTFTHDDPVSKVAQSTALAILNRKNPELGRYIRRGLSYAEGESMISQRPSDFRTRMAAFLSTAASGASPEMIADIESRRRAILDPLNETVGQSRKKASVPQSPAAQPKSGGKVQKVQKVQSYEEWKKANGIP